MARSGGTSTKWTDQQRAGIETVGHNLLVSAAAGSGKTSVLAERCAYLICDAKPQCDADELLVVTFTKAAAAEMRVRIETSLRQRLNDQPASQRLARQIMLLDRAQISTLHGFCTQVLRRHFHVLGLDPNFRVLDEEEATLLRREMARDLLDDRYESKDAGEFQQFIDDYANGNDTVVLEQILRLHGMMGSVVDREGWLARAIARIEEGASDLVPLAQSGLGARWLKSLGGWLEDLRRRWVQLAEQIRQIAGLESYAEYVNDLLAAVIQWQEALGDGNFDALGACVATFAPGKLPSIRKPPPEKESIQGLIDSIRAEMKTGPLAQTCRFTEQQWREGLKSILPGIRVLVELVRDFERRFSAAKKELRGVDFVDLEQFTLRILRATEQGDDLAPSAIAHDYQRQFRHVLVDEYQDINQVQDAILSLVSRGQRAGSPATSLEPNLFCVGDVKQSIYRFRLAQPQQFLNRYSRFEPWQPAHNGPRTATPSRKLPASTFSSGLVINLGSNFRSRGPLLEVINGLFERLMTQAAAEIEYDQSQRLQAFAKFPPADDPSRCFAGSPVELHLLPESPREDDEAERDVPSGTTNRDLDRTEQEAAFIAQRISELMGSAGGSRMQVADKSPDGNGILRPIGYRDIVILLRSMKFKSKQFSDILRAAGIPVHSQSGTGFFESTEIRDMLCLLKLLDNQQQDVPLAAVLRSPLSGLADADDCLARIRLAFPDADAVPFHQAVMRYAHEQDDELSAQLRAFERDLREWRRLAHQRPLAEVLWHIYDSTGYLAFSAGMQDGQQRVANLIDLHERARQFGSFQRQGLGRFMEFLDSLAEQSDLGQPSVASEADNVVRIMSIHHSKGLEFPVVFVPDLGKKHNAQDTAGAIMADRETGIGLMVCDEARRVRYPSLAHVVVKDQIKRQLLAEELRVLYVAMTRAKEHLILTGTCKEKSLEQWKAQWSAHPGPLPVERVLGAGTMLDWIGPAAAAMDGAGVQHRFRIIQHNAQELSQRTSAGGNAKQLTEEQIRLARLEPLVPAPPDHPDALGVRRRLAGTYQYARFAQLEASRSVGSLTKQGRLAPAGASPSREAIVPFEAELPAPRCVLEKLTASPTETGSATHLVLEHLDFGRTCDSNDLGSQIGELVGKKLISPALAETVDLNSILWLLGTPLGHLLRRNANALLRELPVYFPYSAPEAKPVDPLDRVMIRGRADVVVPDADGLVIIDYKTDRVTEQTVDARAEFYRPQLAAYRDAVATIVRQPVKSAHLVFLTPRMIRNI